MKSNNYVRFNVNPNGLRVMVAGKWQILTTSEQHKELLLMINNVTGGYPEQEKALCV